MDKEFAGLTAIITGAGSGIGLAVAKGLKERGATVFGFDINQGEMAPFATFVKCDIADAASVELAFTEFKKASNKLDILIKKYPDEVNAVISKLYNDKFPRKDKKRIFKFKVLGKEYNSDVFTRNYVDFIKDIAEGRADPPKS